MYQGAITEFAIAEAGSSASGRRHEHSVGPAGWAALLCYVVTGATYFWYRIPLWNPAAPILSSLLLGAELFGVMTLALHVYSTWRVVEREAPAAPDGCHADILITTYNEHTDILRYTLLAAKQVRLAGDIWLLDDGCRDEMRKLAAELGVRYVAREDRSHAKAGNLNNALQLVQAPFVAILDCDHAPAPEFLERTLGHFIDPSVAFVQTPQDFYNVDSFQHRSSSAGSQVWHEQTLFYRVIQAGKDRLNATFFCGSCAIMRTEALRDIGGFATGTITEDMHTSLRFHKRGWTAVYHQEALAFGLSPADLDQYATQRLRWGRGAMQVWIKEGILFARGLTLRQRLAYFTSAVTYFEGWQKAIIYSLPVIVILTGWMPIVWAGWPFMMIFILWYLSGVLLNEIVGRGYAKTVWTEEYNFIRFYTFIKATMAIVIPLNWKFSVTKKGLEDTGKTTVLLFPQLAVAGVSIISIGAGIAMFSIERHMPSGAFIANLFWLAFNAALATKALYFIKGRMGQKRMSHRFCFPFVASYQCELGTETVVANELSSTGMSVSSPVGLAVGTPVKGTLSLPGGAVPFEGAVANARVLSNGSSLLGISFQWSEPADADLLNSCLYGNSLQWDINGWSETVRQRWAVRLRNRLSGVRLGEVGQWARGLIKSDGPDLECILRTEGDLVRAICYEVPPSTSELSVGLPDGGLERLRVVAVRRYDLGQGHLHLLVLGREQLTTVGFHREPAWANLKPLGLAT